MTREQLQQIPTVDDLLQLRMAVLTELDGLKRDIASLRDEMATSGLVRPKRIFYTPKEFGGKIGVNQRTVIAWLVTGIIKGSQPNGYKSSWIIPVSEYERLETEALDAELPVKKYMRMQG